MGRDNKQRRAARKRRKQRPGGHARPQAGARRLGEPHGGGGPHGAPAGGPGAPAGGTHGAPAGEPHGAPAGGTHGAPAGEPHTESAGGSRATPPRAEDLVQAAVAAWGTEPDLYDDLLEALADRVEETLPVARGLLDAAVVQLWQRGWAPADLAHVVARKLTARHADVAAEVAAGDARRRVERGEPLHPRWRDQVASLQPDGSPTDRLLPAERLRLTVDLLALVVRLPHVPATVPPPGDAASGLLASAGRLDQRVLQRVRALLAKAESTSFEEEAEALTAKAQELIARHAIDEALLHTAEDVGEPSVRRIPVPDPYADAKAVLLNEVAGANRCRVVYSPDLGWVTAFGYDHDLDAVELLSASLLVQAAAAMARHGSWRDEAGRSRTRSFRRAFLLGFAQRVGERLREATEGQMSEAAGDSARFLPVLAAREDRLREAVEAAFPDADRRSTSSSNPAGWWAGHAAAEQANLDLARRLPAS